MTELVERWQQRLASRVSMGAAERAEWQTRLLDWCDRHAVTPSCWSRRGWTTRS
ncbi:MAG: hypothetical protein WKF47_14035 [Geodermatophilaceae bacterium]